MDFDIHYKGKAKSLEFIKDSDDENRFAPKEIPAKYTQKLEHHSQEEETAFHCRMIPGDFVFFKVGK